MLLLLFTTASIAQRPATDGGRQDSLCQEATVFFPINDNSINRDYLQNRPQLSRIDSTLRAMLNDTTLTLLRLTVQGYGSPEGRHGYNEQMARERANSLRAYVLRQGDLPADRIFTRSIPEDWEGLAAFVEATPDGTLRHKRDILQIIRSDRRPGVKEWLIRQAYPADFDYLLSNVMPLLRRTDYRIDYLRTLPPEPKPADTLQAVEVVSEPPVADIPVETVPSARGFHMAVKTNLLYDAVLVPNIGVEIPFANRWSVSADWFYTWFSSDSRHRYWQGYGGYLTVRRYFGDISHSSLLTSHLMKGHHLGLYMLGLTYDVEWGGRGYQAARFGFGGGVEYGYALPIGRRLSLDFSIGVGFQDGEYKEYDPTDDGTGHYVWQSTRQRHWWGPTKAEVSLKWRIF